MSYDVRIQPVHGSIIASTRRRVTWSEIGQVIMPLFGEVYAFLDASAIGGRGRNVALYHGADGQGAELEAGVEVSQAFTPSATVACSRTPSGLAAHTTHVGDYQLLGQAHEAVIHWLEGGGKKFGLGWEVYGDWHDDPRERRTDVYRLIEG
jgi:hypothetical protein